MSKVSTMLLVLMLGGISVSALSLTGCTGREVAAGAIGAGAGYVLSKEIDD